MKSANQRILHPLLFPLPTSFPRIFPRHSDVTGLSVFSALSSDPTTITSRLKGLADDGRRLTSAEDRELLVNSISEIASNFEEEGDLE